jgi:transposase
MGSRVELFARIRRDARVEGSSIRELARRHHVARKTVRKALNSPLPPERKTPERSSPRLDPFKVAAARSTLVIGLSWSSTTCQITLRITLSELSGRSGQM